MSDLRQLAALGPHRSWRRARVVAALACTMWSVYAPGKPALSMAAAPEVHAQVNAAMLAEAQSRRVLVIAPIAALDSAGDNWAPGTGSVTQALSPAAGAKPDTCQAASFAGGTLDVNALRLPPPAGAAVTVAFWMHWNGVDGAMPLSFASQGLWLMGGSFGFTTGNGDVYGIASSGLAGGWHHVVARFVNGGVSGNQLVVDGAVQTLTQRAGTPLPANAVVSASLRLGGRLGAASDRFGGQLDDVHLYAGALTAAHMDALRTSATPCATESIRLLSPVTNAGYAAPATIELAAEAMRATGAVYGVEYYHGSTLLGVGGDRTSAYRYVWSDVPEGTYTLTAKIVNVPGTSSNAATVTVAPTLGLSSGSVTSPGAGATLYADGGVHLRGEASAAPGYTVAWVEYWWNGGEIGWSDRAPYPLVWQNPPPGTHTIEVRIVDTAGYRAVGVPFTVTVVAGSPALVYYVNDPAGSPIAATDEYGNVVWTQTYAPYGARWGQEDTGTKNGLWYTGQPTEDGTGLAYFGARWYSPQVGRFYSVDPIAFSEGNPKSFNRYAYGNNNPYRYRDADGRAAETLWDIGNVIFDAGKIAYGWLTQKSGLVQEGYVDLAADVAAAAVPFIPAGVTKLARSLEVAEATTVIGRVKDLQNLGRTEKSLLDRLPDLGNAKANWQQNAGVLRDEMRRGAPIRDASPGDTAGQFLNAERNLLRDRGWTFDPQTNFWMPPKP